ncbi:MAG TPA: RIP metalloprotease [Chloroflexi bacterium]|nr:RIP metalloprotease [Chloroflexota bacterium]
MEWINVIYWLAGTLVIVLGPIILIHEIGHFVSAKLAGVRIEEFGLGYPPRMLKLWRSKGYLEIGSTRVTIPSNFDLPSDLGVGIWVDAITQRGEDGSYLVHQLSVLTSPLDELAPKRERTDEGVRMRGEVTELEPGTLYSLNWLPMGGFVRLTGEENPEDPRSLAAQPKRWRIAVLASGAIINIIAALLLLVGAYTTGLPDQWLVEITRIEPGGAAEEAGLQPGDIILAVAGQEIQDGVTQVQHIIHDSPEQPIQLTIRRGEEALTVTARPQLQPGGYGLLGVGISPWPDRSSIQHIPLRQAFEFGLNDISAAILATVQLPSRLIQGDVSPSEARPASMVGISGMLAFSLQRSVDWRLAFPALQTAAFVSLALGLTNLLPLPALDGGRILFVLVEALRGRRVPPDREAMFHVVGMLILISLMLFVMLQDVINPIIPWSWLK